MLPFSCFNCSSAFRPVIQLPAKSEPKSSGRRLSRPRADFGFSLACPSLCLFCCGKFFFVFSRLAGGGGPSECLSFSASARFGIEHHQGQGYKTQQPISARPALNPRLPRPKTREPKTEGRAKDTRHTPLRHHQRLRKNSTTPHTVHARVPRIPTSKGFLFNKYKIIIMGII